MTRGESLQWMVFVCNDAAYGTRGMNLTLASNRHSCFSAAAASTLSQSSAINGDNEIPTHFLDRSSFGRQNHHHQRCAIINPAKV